ncbi:hypothetical protein SAMN05428977_10446 [Nitrosomonas sp. Nm166]|nr:hypothetical protein SAMN05428977_10446 [Nitrosomonas sp. Nm166]
MHIIPNEIPHPKNEADFEKMCAQIYGVVFQDSRPKINGRKGQEQYGIDVFVNDKDIGRIGIQCKKYLRTILKRNHIDEEIQKADTNKVAIKHLIFATTSPNDASLLKEIQRLSDYRKNKGLFTVEIEFWEDIELRINSYPILQNSYAPNSPGASFYIQNQKLDYILELGMNVQDRIANSGMLPIARTDSANIIISTQLDQTNDLIKKYRYQNAIEHIDIIGKDLGCFDVHQKARWHLQRGLCLWFSQDDVKEAAHHFLKAADLYPDDERIAAAHVRGLMLNNDFDAALDVGMLALERFPLSKQIWLAYINVKMMKGEIVRLEDIPSNMREEPDALQLIAIAASMQDNSTDALSLSIKAATHPEASFFTRITALNLVVQNSTNNPVAAMYGVLTKTQYTALEQVVNFFEPRIEKLWSVQSSVVQEATALLGFAFLLRHKPENALEIVNEAKSHGINSPEILRIHIQALSELQRDKDALMLGRNHLSVLTRESIVIISELAAYLGDIDYLEEVILEARKRMPGDQEVTDQLLSLRWAALAKAGKTSSLLSEIDVAKIVESGNFLLTCNAARLLYTSGYLLEATELIEKSKSLLNSSSQESDRLMLAELLFKAERWMEAAEFYESLAPTRQISVLHTRLFTCYIEADNRKKAKEFLNCLPENWIENDEIRQLAITLGYKAGDWAFLLPLADIQILKAPTEAASWLFKLQVALHSETPATFQQRIRQVPEDLNGSIRNIVQLASIELKYNEPSKGLKRLYRLLRQNFDEPEVFSAYFISIITAPTELPLMEDSLMEVVPGSALVLIDDLGHELQVVIDPSDTGILAKRTNFFQSDSSEGSALIGAKVGQKIEIPAQAFGGKKTYTVKSIQSAYKYMIQIVREREQSFGGLPNLKAVPIGDSGDGNKDFRYILDELKHSKNITRQLLEAYGAGNLTLAGFAKMLGRSPIDVVTGWSLDSPPIFIGTGLTQEKNETLALLARKHAIYVIDALTLAEFINFGAQEVLAALPKIYISPVTMAILKYNLSEAEDDKSIGTAIDSGNQIGFIEFDGKYKERRIAFANQLIEAANKYCTIQPSYGELIPPVEIPGFKDILQIEECETLLLAKEYNATLLTLDGRLRMLGKAVEVNSIWPQVLLMYCLETKRITAARSAEFTINQFLSNRKFVSLSSWDLVWMVMQGDSYIQRGIQAFKKYLESSDAEFESTTSVALGFLSGIAELQTQLGAFGELFAHIVESIFRRKDCPEDYHKIIEIFVYELLEELAGKPHFYPPINWARDNAIRNQQKYVLERLAEAKSRSEHSPVLRPIAVRVIYGTKIPYLIMDKSLSINESAATATAGNNVTFGKMHHHNFQQK